VTGVPKTVVNDQVEIMGAVPQEMFVPEALSALSAAAQQPESRA
jgi:predicted DsbA family dithiol-disulfide isomerase